MKPPPGLRGKKSQAFPDLPDADPAPDYFSPCYHVSSAYPGMPSITPVAFTILTAVLTLPATGQEARSRILRSDQNAILEFKIRNNQTTARDYVVRSVENSAESWSVIYLANDNENITSAVLSPAGALLRIPPGPGGMTIRSAFFAAGTPEDSLRTVTLSASPLDGESPPQSIQFRVRLMSVLRVNDFRDLHDPDPDDESLDADPSAPGEQITLRSALKLANSREGLDRIVFAVPSEGSPHIALQSPLPEITGPVVIDGTTLSETGTSQVEISGQDLPAGNRNNGMVLSGGGSTLRGLSFTRFRSTAFGEIPSPLPPNPSGILLRGQGGNRVEDCSLGLSPPGESGAGNEGYGIRIECPDNLISNCHVAGNWVGGIGIFGPEATGNTISATVGGSISSLHSSNLLAPGIPFAEFIFSPSPATSAPSFQVLDRNLANSSIFFTRLHAENPWESPAAGYLGGIVLHQAPGNIIAECRVQGNGADGIRVIGDARDTILRANIAGSRLAPFSMRNSGNGIALECDHAVLEGNETHRNLRSGVLVRGVGNAVKGLRSSGNGECGIRCEGRQTMIGGTLFSDRAQIYSNPVGILLTSPPQPAPYVPGLNQVRGSLIGAEAPFGPGTPIPRPNLRGIHIMGSSENRIGGRPLSSETNRIIYNQMEGVLVSSGTGNRLRGNFISGNGRLDIDLSGHSEGDGLDPPDPDDLDEGGNHKINSPVLNQVVQSGEIVELTGNLTGSPPGIYELEIVIALPSSDLSGSHYSEILPLEHISPARPFAFTLQSAIDLRGTHIRASITDSSLNTSEYSNWTRIEGPRDTDADGISDSVETGSGSEDSNGDGIPDIRQAHVSSFPTLLTGGLSIAAPEGLSLDHISALSVSNLPPVTTQQFPYGVWEFSLGGLPDGGSASLAVLASQQDPAHGFYCFGPTPENPAPHWYDFSFDGTTGLQIIGDQVILSFVDGGRGDHDLTVNGRITSLGGSTNTLPPVPTPSFSSLSDGSVVISWPALPEAFRVVLQENPDPGQLPWNLNSTPVLESPVSSMVRVIPTRPGSLFRLLRP